MKRAKYLFVIFFSVLVYVLFSVLFGQNSFRCYSKMEEQKRLISIRCSEIQNINSELALELTALQNDKAVIAAYARKLDYVSDGEKLVKVKGLKPAQTTLYDIGTVLRHQEAEYISEKTCKIISIFFFFGILVIFILYDINCGNITTSKNKKPIVTGIPIYDLQQI